MTRRGEWEVATLCKAVTALPFTEWCGCVWRIHRTKYRATDPSGSLLVSGRYNKGADIFPPEERWPALYTATAPDIALAEAWRYINPNFIDAIKSAVRSEIRVRLSLVLDCRDVAAVGIGEELLLDDWNYDAGHVLGRAAVDRGTEAILVPSTTRLGDILVVFTDNLRPSSHLTSMRSEQLSHLRR